MAQSKEREAVGRDLRRPRGHHAAQQAAQGGVDGPAARTRTTIRWRAPRRRWPSSRASSPPGWTRSASGSTRRARKVKAKGFNKATREALFHAAHDIKGEAATFGYPLAAASADSLCRLIEHTPDMTRIPLRAGRSACRCRARHHPRERADAAETTAATLTKRLREVTDEFLAHENRDRPDYLDGILAPAAGAGRADVDLSIRYAAGKPCAANGSHAAAS